MQAFESIENKIDRVRFVYDEQYDPFFWLDENNPDSNKYCKEESEKLESGEWVVIGIIKESQCESCGHFEHKDSIWGCVVGNREEAVSLAFEHGFLAEKEGA